MFSRPLCPDSDMPADLEECLYRCFEAHRQRVLQRRSARQAKRAKHRSGQSQNVTTEQTITDNLASSQYQDALTDETSANNFSETYDATSQQYDSYPAATTDQSTNYSNLFQDTQQQYEHYPTTTTTTAADQTASYSDLFQDSQQQYQNFSLP